MGAKETKLELLQRAFSQFNETSQGLERSYRLLEEQVRELKAELEEKNETLRAHLLENEALRAQAERNDRLAAVGEMALRMAHELRNPLGSIELFSGLLRNALSDSSEERRWAEHISTAVASMDYVLSNLLLFTRKPNPRFRWADLSKLIEEAEVFASHLIAQHQIRFVRSTVNLSGPLWCDDDLMRQILLNLIQNAIDAMPRGGELRISAQGHQDPDTANHPFPGARDEGIVLTVTDSGCGIPKEILPRIFDPFFTTKSKGTGLGLAIVHNAVLAHGASIRVESEPGLRTTFSLIFPPVHQKEAAP